VYTCPGLKCSIGSYRIRRIPSGSCRKLSDSDTKDPTTFHRFLSNPIKSDSFSDRIRQSDLSIWVVLHKPTTTASEIATKKLGKTSHFALAVNITGILRSFFLSFWSFFVVFIGSSTPEKFVATHYDLYVAN
jgi:hypothetical protein